MVKITPIIPSTLALQTFSPEDFAIIPNTILPSEFNPGNNFVEYFVYDYNNNLLTSDNQLNSFTPARLSPSGDGTIAEISLNPEQDALDAGYNTGIVKTVYNFVEYQLKSNPQARYYISNISPSRTEIRLSSNQISEFTKVSNFSPIDYSSAGLEEFKTNVTQFFTDFKEELLNNEDYFDEFYLNLGNNVYLLGVNIMLELDLDNKSMSLLVKLYEPLPANIGPKTELYIVTKPAESVGYQLEFEQTIELDNNLTQLAGPNYNVEIKDQTGPTTVYKTYSDITTTTLSGSFSELMSNISSSSPTLTIDYTDYEDFVFFSSAKERLTNFKNKLITISASQADLDNLYSSISGPTSESIVVSSSKNIIEKQFKIKLRALMDMKNTYTMIPDQNHGLKLTVQNHMF